MSQSLIESINSADVIFMDFDGVIKESVEIKSRAFEDLFVDLGPNFIKKIQLHHRDNGGVSRFHKIPLYLSWAQIPNTTENIQNYCNRFSIIVKQKVIESLWVPGAIEFIEKYRNNKVIILVTATPEVEIKEILEKLGIFLYFNKVFGYPVSKQDAIKSSLKSLSLSSKNAIMIGDSSADYDAAINNNISFLLRKTSLNKFLQKKCLRGGWKACYIIKNFNNLSF